jgi:hypothetical protein
MPDDGDGDGDGARGRLHLCVPNVWCALPCCVAFCWSLKRVSELAEHVNESKRQSESRERVSAIAAAFGRAKKKSVMLPTSYRGAPFELMSAARTWLRDGDVWETSTRGGADLKLRTCFLFNDLLVVAEAMEQGQNLHTVSSLRFSRMIALGPTTVLKAEWVSSPFYKPGKPSKAREKKAAAAAATGRIDPTESAKIPVITIITHHDAIAATGGAAAGSGGNSGGASGGGGGSGGSEVEESAILLARDQQEFQDWHRALQAAVNWQSAQKRSYLAKAQARSRRRLSDAAAVATAAGGGID